MIFQHGEEAFFNLQKQWVMKNQVRNTNEPVWQPLNWIFQNFKDNGLFIPNCEDETNPYFLDELSNSKRTSTKVPLFISGEEKNLFQVKILLILGPISKSHKLTIIEKALAKSRKWSQKHPKSWVLSFSIDHFNYLEKNIVHILIVLHSMHSFKGLEKLAREGQHRRWTFGYWSIWNHQLVL